MPALQSGESDYGVVIHEGRFTFEEYGLELVADLGDLWEKGTNLPLPLGGIVARSSLGAERLAACSRVIRSSLHYAHVHRDEAFVTMQRYAQELSAPVIWSHVDLYVNDLSLDLGHVGLNALAQFEEVARRGLDLGSEQPRLSFVG